MSNLVFFLFSFYVCLRFLLCVLRLIYGISSMSLHNKKGITQRVRVAKHGIINETEVPLVIVVSVSVCATLLLLLNVVLLSYCHLAKKQRKRLERRQSSNQDTYSESKEIAIKKKINFS